jgi:hypothetical protein
VKDRVAQQNKIELTVTFHPLTNPGPGSVALQGYVIHTIMKPIVAFEPQSKEVR